MPAVMAGDIVRPVKYGYRQQEEYNYRIGTFLQEAVLRAIGCGWNPHTQMVDKITPEQP